MTSESLDPRMNRLNLHENEVPYNGYGAMDQFQTYETFVQLKEGKPFEHVGIVHAPNDDMAFLFGKEQYTRRGNFYSGLAIIATDAIMTTIVTEKGSNILDLFTADGSEETGAEVDFDIFYLKKRGRQAVHAGKVMANSYQNAVMAAKEQLYQEGIVCVWAVKSSDVVFSDDADKEIWNTVSEKKYREAIAYKSQDKITRYKEAQQGS